MSKTKYGDLKPCLCGGEVKLVEYHETCDGRGDEHAKIICDKCGIELYLTFDEFYKAQHDFGYTGGYYSSNKKYWEGIHQRLIDKWNHIFEEHEDRNLNIVGVKAEAEDDKVKTFSNFLIELINLAAANECEVNIRTSRSTGCVRINFAKRGLSTSLVISKDELEMCPGKVWNEVKIRFESFLHYYKTMPEGYGPEIEDFDIHKGWNPYTYNG